MELTISKNIRHHRTLCGMTQEQLAEAVGVSPQAVSRWENSSSYPDISLLPVLARLFNISTDTLLGADTAAKQEQIKAALSHNKELHRRGLISESIEFTREKLKEFPDSADMTYQYAYALTKKRNSLPRGKEQDELSQEVIRLCERALLLDAPVSWITHACRQQMCLSYHRLGMNERAATIVESMPTWWVSREYLSTYIFEPNEAKKQRQYNLISLMDMMILHLRRSALDAASPEDSIVLLDKAVTLAGLITGDDHKFYDERVFRCVMLKAQQLCRCNMPEKAIETLEKAVFLAKRFESRPERSSYDVFWLDMIEDDRTLCASDTPESLTKQLLQKLDEEIFDILRNNDRFKKIRDGLI